MRPEPPYQRWHGHQAPDVVPADFTGIVRHTAVPLGIRRELYEGPGRTGPHRHLDFLALYSVRGGRGVHNIDNNPYGITRGDVYLMAPGAMHEYIDFQNLEVDAFYFQTELFSTVELAALRESPGFWRLFAADGPVEHRFHLAPESFREVESQIEALRAEWSRDSLAAALLLRAGFFRLLVTLARFMEDQGWHDRPNMERAPLDMTDAVRYCEEHFLESISVPQLAARFFLSSGHFSELFSRQAGMPPAAYLRNLRLEKARVLLKESALSATQIALATGFGDAAHFSRAFRATYGMTPSQYRKKS
jgi:AraC family L-rhamnose operon regulatory protein RhaS